MGVRREKAAALSDVLLWLLMAGFVQMIDGERPSAIPVMIQLRFTVLPNQERFFFSDMTFLIFSIVFMPF